jgi:hypothetical protein
MNNPINEVLQDERAEDPEQESGKTDRSDKARESERDQAESGGPPPWATRRLSLR